MQIRKQEILMALEKVRPGLSANEYIEQSTSFAFMKGKVVTFNDEISVSHPIECNVQGAVKAEELYKLLLKIEPKKDDCLEVEQGDCEITIRGKRTIAGIRLQNEIRIPLGEIDPITKNWYVVPSNLITALKLAAFSASKDMSRPILTSLAITKNAVYSSDSYRMTKILLDTEAGATFLIPATVVIDLIRYPITKYQVQENWVHFFCEGKTIFSFRTISGEFPTEDIDNILNFKGQSLQFTAKTRDAVCRAEIFSKKKEMLDETVKITIKGRQMKVMGTGEYGWCKETLALSKAVPKNIEFQINPTFLRDVLQLTNKCLIGDALIKFTSDTFSHATSLHECE